jgi:phospholipid/cholesterol/gamma-HCH transport system substrate-binding protein
VNLELPARAVAAVIVFFVVSLIVLAVMLGRLGVQLPGTASRSARVLLANAEGLPAQADVLVHGVKVGVVSTLAAGSSGTLVTLSLDSSGPVLHPDASARVGFKTPLGEPFVDLDPGRAPGEPHGLLRVRPTVAIDDAIAWLDPGGRSALRSSLIGLGDGVAAPGAGMQLNGTVAELSAATSSLGRLAAELRAQRADLIGTIGAGRIALDVLTSRAAELSSLTTDAQTTLSAVGAQRGALGAVLDRLPGVLGDARRTLTAARPLIATATPVVDHVKAAAPALTAALRAVPSATTGLDAVLSQANAIRTDLLPALQAINRLARPAAQALTLLGPALADIVPIVQYLGPRGRTIAAWFANTADLGSHGDAKGDWARFFVMFDPATMLGIKSGAPQGNSYTSPGDAAHNQPYRPGDFPRLMPYAPALGR